MRFCSSLLLPFVAIPWCFGQTIVSYTGDTYSESFDSMGPAGTSTPPGWYVGYGVPVTNTVVVVGDGSSAPTGAAGWNYGTTGAPDRALGTAPAADSRRVLVRIRNDTGKFITAFTVLYDGEEWRRHSSGTPEVLTMQYSFDGSNYTAMPDQFEFTMPVTASFFRALDGNEPANRVAGIGGEFTPARPISPGGELYLLWYNANETGTDGAMAIDNFSFEASLSTEVAPFITVQPQSQTAAPGASISLAGVADGTAPLTYQWLFNEGILAGSTGPICWFSSVGATNAGSYALVVTNDFGATTSRVATLSVLPPPWQATDIGSVGVPGYSLATNGTFVVRGSGADIWNQADAFQFVYVPLTGSGAVIARILSQQETHPWAKAGVMVRETLAPGSKSAASVITSGYGMQFVRRTTTGASAVATTPYDSSSKPRWLKLERIGDLFTAYTSLSLGPSNWVAIGTDVIPMAGTVYAGIAVCAHDDNQLNLSALSAPELVPITAPAWAGLRAEIYEDINLGDLTLAQTNPCVNYAWGLDAPYPGLPSDRFSIRWTGWVMPRYSETYTFSTTTDDGVRLWVNEQNLVNRWVNQPETVYSGSLVLEAGKWYPLKMEYYDNTSGAVAKLSWSSASQSLEIVPFDRLSTYEPTFTLTSPTNGQIHYPPADLLLSAVASSLNDITNIEFYANGNLIGSVNNFPDDFAWQNPPPGLYQVTAIAYDAVGVQLTATVSNVFVDVPITNTDPPRVLARSPAQYYISNALTSVEVTFSRMVTGVDAADLQVNGVAATNVIGAASNYVFTFPQPAYGPVAITWAPGHGIADLAPTPHPFDETDPDATWNYLTLDTTPPVVARALPPPNVTVHSLNAITLTFNKPVTGVQASDLLINGQPAQALSGSGSGPYTFSISPQPPGLVRVEWAAGQAIWDLVTPPNAFGGGSWSFTLDPGSLSQLVFHHVLHISVDGLGSIYLQDYVSNSPALFPNFARLKRESAFTFNARTDYDITVTTPNHACMLTGRPVLQPSGQTNVQHGYYLNSPSGSENIQNYGNNPGIYKASVFDVIHDRALSTALYAGKPKFDFYVNSWDETYGAPDPIGVDNGRNKIDFWMLTDVYSNLYGSSEALVDSVVDSITNAPRTYTFLHFAEPDSAGHAGGWGGAGYSNSVRHVDQQLGRIFAALDCATALSNQFAMVLTADHGGGTPTTSHDVATSYKNYTIPLFLWGPGIPAEVDLYSLFANRYDPGTNRPDYNALKQPLRNGDSGNLALALLGLPPIPGAFMLPALQDAPAWPLLTKNSEGFTVAWPASLFGYHIQSSTDIVSPQVWQVVHQDIELQGTLKVYRFTDSPAVPIRIFRLQQNIPAQLLVTHAGQTLTLSWPISPDGYELECTSAPAGIQAPVWQLITNGVRSEGTKKVYSLTLSPEAPIEFFRLKASWGEWP